MRLTFEPLEVLERSKASTLGPEREDNLLTLDEAMSKQIRQALQRCNGKVSGPRGAARLLGINPNTLRSRMRKLGISLKVSC
jgi:transcriptional regulator with GAF, ATPase, and Fis domain